MYSNLFLEGHRTTNKKNCASEVVIPASEELEYLRQKRQKSIDDGKKVDFSKDKKKYTPNEEKQPSFQNKEEEEDCLSEDTFCT